MAFRVADALDRTHLQNVEGVKVEEGSEGLDLVLDCDGDCLLERWALAQKKTLFENTFNTKVTASG